MYLPSNTLPRIPGATGMDRGERLCHAAHAWVSRRRYTAVAGLVDPLPDNT